MIIGEDVPLGGFLCLVCTRLPGESHHRGLWSLLLCLCGLLSVNQLPLRVDINNRSIYKAQKLVCRNCSKRAHTRIHRHPHAHTQAFMHACTHTHTHTQILRQQPYNLHRNTKSKQLSKSQESPTPASHSHTHTQPGETKGRVGEREREAVQAQLIWFSIVNLTFDCCQWQSNLRERDRRLNRERNQKQNLEQEPYTITHRTVGSICQVLQWNSRQSCLSAVVGSVSRRRSVSGDFSPPPPLRLDVRDPAVGQVSQSSSKLVFYIQSTGSVSVILLLLVWNMYPAPPWNWTSETQLLDKSVHFFFFFFWNIDKLLLNPFTAMMSLENDQKKCKNLKLFSPLFFFYTLACEQAFIKTCNTESRYATGPQKILRACTFQPGNFTGCGREGVKPLFHPPPPSLPCNPTAINWTVSDKLWQMNLNASCFPDLNTRKVKNNTEFNTKKHKNVKTLCSFCTFWVLGWMNEWMKIYI